MFELTEGDICPECNNGFMGFEPVENCSCHISPPCSQCVNNPLVCLSCGWDSEDFITFIADFEMELK